MLSLFDIDTENTVAHIQDITEIARLCLGPLCRTADGRIRLARVLCAVESQRAYERLGQPSFAAFCKVAVGVEEGQVRDYMALSGLPEAPFVGRRISLRRLRLMVVQVPARVLAALIEIEAILPKDDRGTALLREAARAAARSFARTGDSDKAIAAAQTVAGRRRRRPAPRRRDLPGILSSLSRGAAALGKDAAALTQVIEQGRIDDPVALAARLEEQIIQAQAAVTALEEALSMLPPSREEHDSPTAERRATGRAGADDRIDEMNNDDDEIEPVQQVQGEAEAGPCQPAQERDSIPASAAGGSPDAAPSDAGAVPPGTAPSAAGAVPRGTAPSPAGAATPGSPPSPAGSATATPGAASPATSAKAAASPPDEESRLLCEIDRDHEVRDELARRWGVDPRYVGLPNHHLRRRQLRELTTKQDAASAQFTPMWAALAGLSREEQGEVGQLLYQACLFPGGALRLPRLAELVEGLQDVAPLCRQRFLRAVEQEDGERRGLFCLGALAASQIPDVDLHIQRIAVSLVPAAVIKQAQALILERESLRPLPPPLSTEGPLPDWPRPIGMPAPLRPDIPPETPHNP